MDRRVLRTRKWLQQSFLDLLLEQAFETITVQDISDRANIARVTFYRHYHDKDDLLQDFLKQFFQELELLLVSPLDFSEDEIGNVAQTNLATLYQHVATKKQLFKAVLLSSISAPVRKQWRETIVKQVELAMQSSNDQERLGENVSIIANLMAEGVLGIMVWWLEKDCHVEVEHLATVTAQTFEFGMKGVAEKS